VPGSDVLYNPASVAPQWRAWLTKTRAAPPTDEELARAGERSAELAARVAAIEAREAQRRFRAASLGREDAGGPDLRSFTAQLENQGFGNTGGGGGGGGGGRSSGNGPVDAGGSSSNPQGGHPAGSGEAFKPGVWQPTSDKKI